VTKHNPLSGEEVVAYRPNPEIIRYVGARRSDGRPVRVLDWGCGRGRLVAYLVKCGIDAYGVDVDPETIGNGNAYFAAEGGGTGRLMLLGADGRAPFPDGHFDVVVSDNVLEHVPDLDGVMSEISRITRPGGWGFHLFPARFSVVEGHLAMPLVHWLPKGAMRRLAIRAFTAAGVEPHWQELEGLGTGRKAEVYFAYSRDKTFYRAPSAILRTCSANGLRARLVGLEHPRLKGIASAPFMRGGPLRAGAEALVANLKAVELLVAKPGGPEQAVAETGA
jgi:SAM-dependent methyltransferase